MKQYSTPYIYLDQNIRNKMSKKRFKSFRDKVNPLIGNNTQRFTVFGLIEFAGFEKKEWKKLFDIQYKEQELNEYPFQSFQDVLNCQSILKNQLYDKLPKDFLMKKLEKKKECETDYTALNEQGLKYIDRFIEGIKGSEEVQSLYKGLIDNLCLDRLSQINISKLCLEDKKKVICFFVNRVIGAVSQERNVGGLRLICKIFNERKNHIVEGEQSKSVEKEIIKICGKLKPKGDLMDCELVHLAFFGSNKKHCHCYTTDNENEIKERLILYCKTIGYFIDWYFNSSHIHSNKNGYKRPQWRYGKVFILDEKTGEKIKKISATEIYEKVLKSKIKS